METAVVSVVDLDLKIGTGKNGPWTLCILTGSDKLKYKTFDETLITQLRQAQGKSAPVALTFESKPSSYVDRTGRKQETIERTIKEIKPATGQPAAPSASAQTDKMPPEYWEKKDRLEYQRMAHMSALKACADLMAACIESGVEKYKFHDAVQLVKVEADKLYAAYFKSSEGGDDHGTPEPADDYEYASNE